MFAGGELDCRIRNYTRSGEAAFFTATSRPGEPMTVHRGGFVLMGYWSIVDLITVNVLDTAGRGQTALQ